tara:strand:- start:288 stop:746 length:459 start_codon:yes stop_codon:yes gene_type:complete
MIDLSNAKVDEEYILSSGHVAKSLLVTDDAVVLGFKGITIMVNMSGETLHANGGMSVLAKVDPRSWLKDMPDAGIFTGEFIAFESIDGGWHAFDEEPKMSSNGEYFSTNGQFSLYYISGIKMPTLTGDQWKESKISIIELAQWQKDNKLLKL